MFLITYQYFKNIFMFSMFFNLTLFWFLFPELLLFLLLKFYCSIYQEEIVTGKLTESLDAQKGLHFNLTSKCLLDNIYSMDQEYL